MRRPEVDIAVCPMDLHSRVSLLTDWIDLLAREFQILPATSPMLGLKMCVPSG